MQPLTPAKEDTLADDALEGLTAAQRNLRSQRMGSLLVLCVVGLYVGSGVMIQVLFDELDYEKPFFFSFVSVGLCSLYLLHPALVGCRQHLMPPAHAYSKVLQPSQVAPEARGTGWPEACPRRGLRDCHPRLGSALGAACGCPPCAFLACRARARRRSFSSRSSCSGRRFSSRRPTSASTTRTSSRWT